MSCPGFCLSCCLLSLLQHAQLLCLRQQHVSHCLRVHLDLILRPLRLPPRLLTGSGAPLAGDALVAILMAAALMAAAVAAGVRVPVACRCTTISTAAHCCMDDGHGGGRLLQGFPCVCRVAVACVALEGTGWQLFEEPGVGTNVGERAALAGVSDQDLQSSSGMEDYEKWICFNRLVTL